MPLPVMEPANTVFVASPTVSEPPPRAMVVPATPESDATVCVTPFTSSVAPLVESVSAPVVGSGFERLPFLTA